MIDADPIIRRIERTALIFCGAATVAALALRPDRPPVAAGILGGGVLAFASLFAIRGSIEAILAAAGMSARPADPAAPDGPAEADPAAKRRAGLGAGLKLAGRFGLFGVAAYVMIARLRLHPVGLLIGASSLVAGASFEAVRSLRRP